MDKVLKHLKNNAIIYLILIVCIIVILIALFYKPKEELREPDTSLFEVVNVGQVVHLFDDNSTKFLMVGTNTDQTTANYADYVKYSMLKHEYTPYFLYQEDIDFKKDKDKIEKLEQLLDITVTYQEDSKPVMELIKEGVVPLTIIIKNKKPIYVFIGTLDTTTLDTLVQAYGIGSTYSSSGIEVA